MKKTIVRMEVGTCIVHTKDVMSVFFTVILHFQNGTKEVRTVSGRSYSLNRQAAVLDALQSIGSQNGQIMQAIHNDNVFSGSLEEVCAELAHII